MKTLKEITGDSLEQMIDYKVVDQNGDSVGTLHSLWSDPTTGTVEFLGVKTGWLFGANHVVPAEKAELDETQNVVRLPYTSTFIKEAPSVSAEAEISEEQEDNIYHYYGLGRGGVPDTSTMPAPEDTSHLDKLPETTGASSRATASRQDEGSSNFGSPTSGASGDMAGVSRLRRTVRTEAAGTSEDPSRATTTQASTPTAGQAVRGALDSLVPGDSSSTSTISRSAAAPGSYGTANLYGSTGTSTPVEPDATGTAFEDAGTTTTSGASMVGTHADTKPTVGAANPDVVTGEPGSHPVGVSTGGFAGGAAGGAIGGAVGGPVGAVVGAIAGAVGGGYAGKGIAESVNPTEENAYWENNYRSASYHEGNYDYNDYSPAYRTGYEGFTRHAESGKDYADVESDLQQDYARNRGSSRLEWDKAKVATRDAWDRLKGKFSDATR